MRVFLGLALAGLVTLNSDGALAFQTRQMPEVPPATTVAASDWLASGEPLIYGGAYYYPSGPTVFFEGSVMVQSGVFEGVPFYVDPARNFTVFVPIGDNLMRPYEQRRTGELADTVEHSNAPAAPVTPASPPAPTGTSGAGTRAAPAASAVTSTPRPCVNRGIWIELNGRAWLASKGSVTRPPQGAAVVAHYHGFPVYQVPSRRSEIYIPSVAGGPLARYSAAGTSRPLPGPCR